MHYRHIVITCALAMGLGPPAVVAQPAQPVTVQNFNRAETDHYFAAFVAEIGLGRLAHERDVAAISHQPVIRMNRDTLYSRIVVDLDAGPVTITMPETGGRFQSLLVIDQDHFNPAVIHDAGRHVFTREAIGTRYAAFVFRTFANSNDPADLQAAHTLQDRIIFQQVAPGRLELPSWNSTALDAIRGLLNTLASMPGTTLDGFGRRGTVDPIAHLLATAAGWGGNPREAAIYNNITPPTNDGTTIHHLRLRDVPVDGFWSISVYNESGYFEANPLNSYSVNNVTARRETDGSVLVQFGGCTPAIANCLPTQRGWNSLARLYRPRPAVLSGTWQFPRPEPAR